MTRVGRLTRMGLATLCVLSGGLALTAAPALAGTGYGLSGSFGAEGSGIGQFNEPSGVAVNNSTGDVYVVDKDNNRVEWFNSTGSKFEGQFNGSGTPATSFSGAEGLAIDNSGKTKAEDPSVGDVYVEDVGNKAIDKFSAIGAYEGQLAGTCGNAAEVPPCANSTFSPFGRLLGVAVDPSGNLWALESERTVYEFSDVGDLVQKFNIESGLESPTPGFAVDSSVNAVYTNYYGGYVLMFESATGSFLHYHELAGVSALAFDPTGDHLFVGDGNGVAEFEPVIHYEEAPIDEFAGRLNRGSGIAVSSTGSVYVADAAGDHVDIFMPGVAEAPLVHGVNASAVPIEAKLEAEVSLYGQTTEECKFEYGKTLAYGKVASCNPATLEGFGEQKVSATVTGLEQNTTYDYRIVVKDPGGTVEDTSTFTTPAFEAPKIESEGVSGVSSAVATLQAQINPVYQQTTCSFEYGTEPSLKTGTTAIACPASLGNGDSGVGTTVALSGLNAGTTYYYRVVASNATGTSSGAIERFATVPTPITDAPSQIGTTTATLEGTLALNQNFATQYHFVYRRSTTECAYFITRAEEEEWINKGEYFNRLSVALKKQAENVITSTEEGGTGSGVAVNEIARVTGLEPNSEYMVCFFASNQFSAAAVQGPAVRFTTPPAPPKFIEHSESAAATASASTPIEGVGALLNPNNQETTCSFEYGTESGLNTGTSSVPCEQASVGTSFNKNGDTASAHIEGLKAGETYYYRVVAENAQSKLEGKPTYGEIEQFTVSAAPTVTTEAALDPTRTSIVLSGTINPNGVAISYHFAYVSEAGYQAAVASGEGNLYGEGATTASVQAGEGSTPIEIEVPVKGLLPDTTYHYALVANDALGVFTGRDATFTTAGATPPVVLTGTASEVTMSTATIFGSVNTEGLNVSYAFEVSTEPANPGPPSGGGSIGAGPTEASVSVALQGLQPGTTYYYRVLATSTDGTSYGEIKTFTTQGFPPPLTVPSALPLLATPSIAFPTETGTTVIVSKAKHKTKVKHKAKHKRKGRHAKPKGKAKHKKS